MLENPNLININIHIRSNTTVIKAMKSSNTFITSQTVPTDLYKLLLLEYKLDFAVVYT
jgi:hypothetical protein